MNLLRIHRQTSGFSLIEIMVVLCIIAILAAVAAPNYFSYRNKAFCNEAETDAQQIAAALSNYFVQGSRANLPAIADLNLDLKNSAGVQITGDTNTVIIIQVTDRTKRCPISYQDASQEWDSNYVYTKQMK